MSIIVPPGGFTGFAQMTPASRAALGGVRRRGTSGRRRKRRTKAKTRKTRSSRKRSGGRKIKFGSPAWRKKYKLGRRKK